MTDYERDKLTPFERELLRILSGIEHSATWLLIVVCAVVFATAVTMTVR